MTLKTIGFAMAACGLAVSPATAQQQQQQQQPKPTFETRIPNHDFQREFEIRALMGEPERASRAYVQAKSVARCVLSEQGAEASAILGGAMTDDPDYKALVGSLQGESRECLTGTDGGVPMMINGALAEELLLAGDGEAVEDRAMSINVDEAEAFYVAEKVTLDTIGRCVSVYSPGLAYKVLRTSPGSDEELETLRNLYSRTPECGLRAAPEQIPVVFQRAAIAAGLYHWMNRS